MEQLFIRKVNIRKVRHLENIEIPISDKELKHLILTGKNGSGKTSVLNFMNVYFESLLLQDNNPLVQKQQLSFLNNEIVGLNLQKEEKRDLYDKESLQNTIYKNTKAKNAISKELQSQSIDLEFNRNINLKSKYENNNFIYYFFKAKREGFDPVEPKGPKNLKGTKRTFKENANDDFHQFLVNQRTKRSYANDDNDTETILQIDNWFGKIEQMFRVVFDDDTMTLDFDKQNFYYSLSQKNHEKFDFNTLSDGYSAVIDLVTELIMQMELRNCNSYNAQGIVLIDEIETHLHIELQKKVLPFLTSFFPNIQFIITTHSPFVLNSIEKAVIYDLENRIMVENLTGISYDGIVESYFKNDKYSEFVKNKVIEYETLISKNDLTSSEKDRLADLKIELEALPKYFSPELATKINLLNLQKIGNDKY